MRAFQTFTTGFRDTYDRLLLAWRLMKDPRVPIWYKALPVLILAYVLSPLDLIPDVLVGLGQIDDITMLLMGLRLFERIAPQDIVDEHRRAVRSRHTPPEVVDTPGYRVVEPNTGKNGAR